MYMKGRSFYEIKEDSKKKKFTEKIYRHYRNVYKIYHVLYILIKFVREDKVIQR